MPRWFAVLLATGLLAASSVAGLAQSANPAPCSVEPEPLPCGTVPASKGTASAPTNATPATTGQQSTTEKFPFPGDASAEPSGPALPNVLPAPASNNSNTDATTGTASSDAEAITPSNATGGTAETKKATTQFPFPEDDKGTAVSGNADAGGTNEGTSSSSSSSNAADDAADTTSDADADSKSGNGAENSSGLQDKGSEGASGRHLLHRVNPVATKLQSPEEREAEDLSIAHYYTQTGDFPGAYLRSQDAVKMLPDDPDAHFALAEAALKLNKREQAIAEYNACLKLDPPEKQAKAVRKALARLTP